MDKTRYYMLNIDRLLNQVIPYPDNRENRDGFNNEELIDQLNSEAKDLLVYGLLEKLSEKPDDLLIVETLGYMKSKKAMEPLKRLLEESSNDYVKICIVSNLYKISPDQSLIDIAMNSFENIANLPMNYFNNRSTLINSFYCMVIFNNEKANSLIKTFFDNTDYLVSYNAKRSLGQIKD